MKGTKFGAMVIPRDPEGSNLMWLLDWRASAEVRMPHGKEKAIDLRPQCHPCMDPRGCEEQLIASLPLYRAA
jgi:hypothetical protein